MPKRSSKIEASSESQACKTAEVKLDAVSEDLEAQEIGENLFLVSRVKFPEGVFVEVAGDQMSAALLSLVPFSEEDRPIDKKTVLEALNAEGVVQGIDEDAIDAALAAYASDGSLAKEVCVASGQQPTTGKDAVLTLNCPEKIVSEGQVPEGVRAWPVEVDETLAGKVSAKPGKPGYTVTGAKIPEEKGRDVLIDLGPGVQNERGGTLLTAKTSGIAVFSKAGLRVEQPLVISNDKLTAALSMDLGEDVVLSRESVDILAERLGICCGLDSEAIDRALEEKAKSVIIARGTLPVSGENARIEYKFDTDLAAGLELEDGSIDFKERSGVIIVDTGEIVAKKIPATDGRPGVTVTGEETPPRPGNDLLLRADKGCAVSEDGMTIVATSRGIAEVIPNGVRVTERITVNSDISYGTGNIHTVGEVEIKGSVQPDFTVEADSDVQIAGGIFQGTVRTQGSITVSGGIIGREGHVVEAGGDICCRFMENAIITADGNVEVKEGVVNSHIVATGSVVIEGTLVGGSTHALGSVATKEIGSELGVKTEIVAGIDMEKRNKMIAAEAKAQTIDNKITQTDKMLAPLLEAIKKKVRIPTPRMKQLSEMVEARKSMTAARDEKRNEAKELRLEAIGDPNATVKVEGMAHSGTILTIGLGQLTLKRQEKEVSFRFGKEQQEIVVDR